MELSRGDTGDAVLVLQRVLQGVGFEIEDDGDFGGETEDAVRAFQGQQGIKVDGIAGNDTFAALGLDPNTLEPITDGEQPGFTTITFTEEETIEPPSAPTRDLADFLRNQDIGVTSHGDSLHIGQAFLEILLAGVEMAEWIPPPALAEAGAATVGGATVFGVGVAYAGPALGLVGTFMALGSGYDEAREEIRNEATSSGFSRGFVAGILNMSPSTTKSLFGMHGVVSSNVMDPESDVMKVNAYNKGLVAGYALAHTATEDEKRAFVFEIRRFAPGVSPGDWGDREKRDYVVEYAAKLRLHYLNEL
jgi:Putative peptidoglycan binding domain